MAKLRYYYGTMGSMKSATLLMKAYQFEQCGIHAITLKPSFDTRDVDVVRSRAVNTTRDAISFQEQDDLFELVIGYCRDKGVRTNCVVFVDEVQFCTPYHIAQLWELAKHGGIDVYCFGLKLSYNNRLFESVKGLFIYADTIEEIKSRCKCGNKASTHLRFVNDKPVFGNVETIVGDFDGDERYESVCTECWVNAKLDYNNKCK